MGLRLNNSESYEMPQVRVCKGGVYFGLDKENTPIAFKSKVDEMLEDGSCQTVEEAEKVVSELRFELEVYYHKSHGLFAVESEVVESCDIYSPYTGEKCEDYER